MESAVIMPGVIAVLGGTGPEGFGLALRWVRAGESVIIGSRDAARAREAAAKIRAAVGSKAKISGEENSTACAAADLLVLTIPFEGHCALLKQIKPAIRARQHRGRYHCAPGRQRGWPRHPHSRHLGRLRGAASR